MAVLGGGMWGGINQGLRDLDQAAIDQKKMDVMDAEVTARNRGLDLQAEQVGMQRDLHGIKMKEDARANKELDIDEIGEKFGKENPSAYASGLEHATRNGYIKVDPVTGKRTIRQADLDEVTKRMDTALGVDDISKRDIALYSDKLRNAQTEEDKALYTEKLNQAKAYNKGALKQMEIEQKALDRESDRELKIALKGMGRGGGGNAELNRQQKEEMFDTNRLDRLRDKWEKSIKDAEKQYSKDAELGDTKAATANWNATVRRLREYYQPKVSALEKKLGYGGPEASPRLGGAPVRPGKVALPTAEQKARPGNTNSVGLTEADIVRPMQDAGITTTQQGIDILVKNFGYKPNQAAVIMKDLSERYFK